jgi:DNA-binding LacI/PurR family transcriptional regulator
MVSSGARRPVIGLLVSTFFDGYQELIWKSVVGAAAEFDVDLLCFLVGSRTAGWPGEALLDLVGGESVDGLVGVAESLGWMTGPDAAAARLGRERRIPTVVFSGRFDGFPRVAVDNSAGVARTVEHLALEHGRTRIAFLTGPPDNGDAIARLHGYRQGLERAGLPFDEALVSDGDFSRSSARAALRRLDERRVAFDAVICASDAMALAAVDELRRLGRQVPDAVAVCGFDDIGDAASIEPPLTTVRQPLHEMGREAVRLVLAQLRGDRVPAETTFPARLVLRQSCGCPRINADVRVAMGPRPLNAGTPAALAAGLEEAFPDFGFRIGVPAWAAELAGALLRPGPEPAGGRPFLLALERLLAHGLGQLPEPLEWLRVLRTLVASAQRKSSDDAEALAMTLAEANALVASMATRAQLARRAQSEEQGRALRLLVQPFPFVADDFLSNLLEQLQLLEVRSFFLSKFVTPDRRRAELVAQLDPDRVVALDQPASTFDARRLVPGTFTGARRRAHAVLPVSSPQGPLGFALCEIGPLGNSGYEMVMHELSMVLSVSGLVSEVREHQRNLLEAARQAGMAEVAVGALHNVGNLLTSVSVSAEAIQATAQSAASAGLSRAAALLTEHAADLPRFFASDPRAQLLPPYLACATEELGREMDRIQGEAAALLERTGLVRDSIRALQEVARGGGGDGAPPEPVELAEVVGAALEIQRGLVERLGVSVRTDLAEVPRVVVERAKLVHVLVNLVKNAVEAMRSTPEGQRRLTITGAHLPDGTTRIDVQDTGQGIAPEHLDRLFSYGFTTKRDGHGFGLHSCATYMKQLGGSIGVRSDGAEQGTTFTLLFTPAPVA